MSPCIWAIDVNGTRVHIMHTKNTSTILVVQEYSTLYLYTCISISSNTRMRSPLKVQTLSFYPCTQNVLTSTSSNALHLPIYEAINNFAQAYMHGLVLVVYKYFRGGQTTKRATVHVYTSRRVSTRLGLQRRWSWDIWSTRVTRYSKQLNHLGN